MSVSAEKKRSESAGKKKNYSASLRKRNAFFEIKRLLTKRRNALLVRRPERTKKLRRDARKINVT